MRNYVPNPWIIWAAIFTKSRPLNAIDTLYSASAWRGCARDVGPPWTSYNGDNGL